MSSGSEGFMLELGPFNYLGLEALTLTQGDTEEGSGEPLYTPDFSAKVINKARLLKIRRQKYI